MLALLVGLAALQVVAAAAAGTSPSLTLLASSPRVLYGHGVTLSGRLTGGVVAGKTVVIDARPYGTSAPHPVAAVSTSLAGRWSYRVNPTIQTSYEAHVGANAKPRRHRRGRAAGHGDRARERPSPRRGQRDEPVHAQADPAPAEGGRRHVEDRRPQAPELRLDRRVLAEGRNLDDPDRDEHQPGGRRLPRRGEPRAHLPRRAADDEAVGASGSSTATASRFRGGSSTGSPEPGSRSSPGATAPRSPRRSPR